MRLASLLLPFALLLGACAAPPAGGEHAGHDMRADREAAPARAASPAQPAAPATPAPAPRPAPSRDEAPRMSDPTPATPVAGRDPATVNRSCRTDADCVVKDVGNCCGYFPACVNTDAKTDPAAVKAQCAARGMASTCGFAEISACTCSAGQCTAAGPDTPVAR